MRKTGICALALAAGLAGFWIVMKQSATESTRQDSRIHTSPKGPYQSRIAAEEGPTPGQEPEGNSLEAQVADAKPEREEVSEGELEEALGTATVYGKVIEIPTRKPVSAAEVLLSGPVEHKTRTGSNGEFRIETVAAGQYAVSISHSTFVPINETSETIWIKESEERGLEIPVERGGIVTGRVTDADTHAGIPGIRLRALDSYAGLLSWNGIVTDSEGSFRIEGLLFRECVVDVIGDENGLYAPVPGGPNWASNTRVRKRLEIARGVENRVDIELKRIPYVLVSGIVVDPNNMPVPGATVRVSVEGWRELGSGKSGNDGQFSLQVPGTTAQYGPVHNWYVQVRDPEFASGRLGAFQEPDEVSDLRLVAYPAGRIAGTVIDTTGAPVPGKEVVMCWSDSALSFSEPQTTRGDDLGHFEFEGLTPDTYWLWVTVDGVSRSSVAFEASGGFISGFGRTLQRILESWKKVTPVTEVALGLGRTSDDIVVHTATRDDLAISGRLVDSQGRPIEQGSISIEGPIESAKAAAGPSWPGKKYKGTIVYETGPDSEGNFRLAPLHEGAYRLTAREFSRSQELEMEPVFTGSQDLVLVILRNGIIEGRVIDAQTSAPIERFLIAVTDPRVPLDHYNTWDYADKVYDEDGRFHIVSRHTGNVEVRVVADGYQPAAVPLVIEREQNYEDILVRLESAVRFSGRVINTRGEPVPGAAVFQGILPEHPDYRNAIRSKADGVFVFPSEAQIPDLITIVHPDYACAVADVVAERSDSADIEVVLDRGGTIEGTVSVNGKYRSRELSLRVLDDERIPVKKTTVARRYQFVHVPTGLVEICLDSRGGYRKQAIVVSGETTIVDFDVSTGTYTGTSSLSGMVVRRDGAPLGGRVEIEVWYGQTSYVRETTYGADGKYYMDGLPAGQALIRVLALPIDSEEITKELWVELVEGEETVRDLEF